MIFFSDRAKRQMKREIGGQSCIKFNKNKYIYISCYNELLTIQKKIE